MIFHFLIGIFLASNYGIYNGENDNNNNNNSTFFLTTTRGGLDFGQNNSNILASTSNDLASPRLVLNDPPSRLKISPGQPMYVYNFAVHFCHDGVSVFFN